MSHTDRVAVRLPGTTWWTQIGVGLFCVGAVALAVVVSKPHAWSWPLFVWGVLVGPVWIGWARFLSKAMSNAVARQASISVGQMAQARAGSRLRWAPTYIGVVLTGIAVATASAGLSTPWPDTLLTILFVLGGVVFPLAVYPKVKRRFVASHASGGRDSQPEPPP